MELASPFGGAFFLSPVLRILKKTAGVAPR
jgi:hypothetical protein